MPESYLHVRCARRACEQAGAPKYDLPATVAGAAGPDILFYYLGLPSLAKLGQRLHTERCGPLLAALVRGADSDVKKGYVLGFLSHNATDASIHPWIYASAENHAALEQALDSVYLLRDKGRSMALPGDGMARLRPDKALEIGGLLSRCILEVYGVHVPPKTLAKTFRDFYRCKGWLRDPGGGKGRLARRAERLLGLEPGTLAGHLIGGVPPALSATPEGLVEQAEALGAQMMCSALDYWRGTIGPLELARRIGSRNYLTGETV